jgi:hypothetical protein
MLNESYKILWERNATEYEKSYSSNDNNLLSYYNNYTIIDDERIIFNSSTEDPIREWGNYEQVDFYKIISLREPAYLHGINGIETLFDGDNFKNENTVYFTDDITLSDGVVRVFFKECEEIEKKDPIFGSVTYSYKHISTLYYDISVDTYQVVGKGIIK